jgi:hypothetical protein
MDEKKESASSVTRRIYEANVLFGVAVIPPQAFKFPFAQAVSYRLWSVLYSLSSQLKRF